MKLNGNTFLNEEKIKYSNNHVMAINALRDYWNILSCFYFFKTFNYLGPPPPSPGSPVGPNSPPICVTVVIIVKESPESVPPL